MSGDKSELERATGLTDIEYAGDGVYVGRDSFQLWAFTHDGFHVGARIALPPDGTFQNLVRYGNRFYFGRND